MNDVIILQNENDPETFFRNDVFHWLGTILESALNKHITVAENNLIAMTGGSHRFISYDLPRSVPLYVTIKYGTTRGPVY